MTPDATPPEPLTPAQERLRAHLEVLRADLSGPAGPWTMRVVRTARWQRAVRSPLRLAGAVAVALGEGIVLLLRGRPARRR